MARKSAQSKSTAVRKPTAAVAIAAHRDHGLEKIIKAAELVWARPAKGRTLGLLASKCLNLMLGVAGGEGFIDKMYSISKKELRRAHKGNERLPAMLEELHTTLFKLDVLSPRGKPAVLTVALLSSTIDELDDQNDNSLVYFRFTPEFIAVHKRSNLWAALSGRVMLGLDSVYALRLYEIGCQMVRRRDPTMKLTVPELRELLHVPPGKYQDWANLRRKTLDKAMAEINENKDAYFTVCVPDNRIHRSGHRVVSLELQFWPKPVDEAAETAQKGKSLPARGSARPEGTAVQIIDTTDLDLLWRKVCHDVEHDPAFKGGGIKNWLTKVKLIGIADSCAMLQAADKLAADWVTHNLDQALRHAFAAATDGKITKIEVTTK
jgi:hypothetical protein